MSEITLGIIGGGQLGSMLAISAKKLNIKTIIYCDDPDAPAQNFCTRFISADYNNKEKIIEFINLVDFVTYEFENIPFDTLNEINKLKPVLPKPSINRLIQHRLAEKDFINKLLFAIIEAANKAALIAPSSPMASVPTGIPFGICTIDNKLSSPLNFLLSIGTPKTGKEVKAEIIPGK